MPLRSSPGSLRYFPTFIFSNSSLWELKCPVTLRTSKRHCCNFKDGLNSFLSLPVKENVLFIDTMQKAQHERRDWGVWGGIGARRWYQVQRRGMGGMRVGGGRACLMHSKQKRSWKAIESQRAPDACETSECKKASGYLLESDFHMRRPWLVDAPFEMGNQRGWILTGGCHIRHSSTLVP